MTDQMHDGKCNELLVREETIHGRGPAEAAYNPNLLASLRFLRLAVFFMLLLAVARAAVFQPPSLPPSLLRRITIPEIDIQADQGGTRYVRGEIQFRDLIDVVVLGRRGGDPGKRTSEHA